MLALTGAVCIHLCRQPTDMRKGAGGLSGLVSSQMGSDPLNGGLFVFCNRRGTTIKLLYWDRDGYALWMKRLERGRYHMTALTEPDGQIDRATLSMLLEGVVALRRHRRYSHRQEDSPVKR